MITQNKVVQLPSVASFWNKRKGSTEIAAFRLGTALVFFLGMSPSFENPVQTQMAVAVYKNPLAEEYHGIQSVGERPTGKRRVFVQTDTGIVLGLDLDRSDNVHTVKRRLQVALNVPTEGSSLTFGDMVLKNDLRAIRKDSSLLLTRNLMHRSSSTPCLSPTGREILQKDQSIPFEILGSSSRFGKTKLLVSDIVEAMKAGVDPLPVHGGLGGAYSFRNSRGECVAIVKPNDEEPFAPNNPKGFVGKVLGQPGIKHSVRVGETGFREVAAYLLDYNNFAGVPPTALVKVTHSVFNVNDVVYGNKLQRKKAVSKIASLQQFVPHDFDASDYGTSSYPVAAVHHIGILDIRILNTDRHAGNLLVRRLDKVGRFVEVELIPIDHGLCLPESLEDPYFEWIHWPQSSIPFSEDELEYINMLDPIRDSEMLCSELPMIREACLRVLILCTLFLKQAAVNGLCLSEIGEMMTREFHSGEEEPSELEVVCIQARRLIAEKEDISPKSEMFDEEFQFGMDFDDNSMTSEDIMSDLSYNLKFPYGNGCSPLSRLDESVKEEGDSEDNGKQCTGVALLGKQSAEMKLCTSLKSIRLGEGETDYLCNSSSGHRSAKEQLPFSASFVKVGDMNEAEWKLFLDKFQEVLHPALEKHKAIMLGQKQRQRLGSSCRF
ncbi:hypothetical protein Leryth_002185 [Lithospermum erythrorhizon]|nr:hypothetical protein Leryth_002185 [Lithospermum erythrorhizon]